MRSVWMSVWCLYETKRLTRPGCFGVNTRPKMKYIYVYTLQLNERDVNMTDIEVPNHLKLTDIRLFALRAVALSWPSAELV